MGLRAGGRLALLALAATCLVLAVAGGLARLGAPWSLPQAAALHAALMIPGFLGTVISLERAVALGHPLAYAAPLAAGLGTLLLAFAPWPWGVPFFALAPVALAAASVAIVRRQAQPHTVLLAVAAVAWALGNAAFLLGRAEAALPAWFAFLVLTIAAERLEMTRMLPQRPFARPTFAVVVAALLAGTAWAMLDPAGGALAFGAALVALAAWLATFDIARRTVRAEGFARYAAVALLAGYAWLAVAGIAWALQVREPRLRDAAMHALGLGFVFSMILAHGPVIVPAIARTRVRFTPFFYGPLALLHASLLLRLAFAHEGAARLLGGALNAAAIALFALTLLARLGSQESGPSR